MVGIVLFWILWILAVLGAFPMADTWPGAVRGRGLILLILIGLLGYWVMGNPFADGGGYHHVR